MFASSSLFKLDYQHQSPLGGHKTGTEKDLSLLAATRRDLPTQKKRKMKQLVNQITR